MDGVRLIERAFRGGFGRRWPKKKNHVILSSMTETSKFAKNSGVKS